MDCAVMVVLLFSQILLRQNNLQCNKLHLLCQYRCQLVEIYLAMEALVLCRPLRHSLN